jgi:hypothetical protein
MKWMILGGLNALAAIVMLVLVARWLLLNDLMSATGCLITLFANLVTVYLCLELRRL